MKKIKNDDNEVLTKKMFREGMDELVFLINKSFVGVESRMATKEDLLALIKRVDKLEKYVENRFNDISRELKDIRKEIKAVDTRAEIFDLQTRVTKLEKRATF